MAQISTNAVVVNISISNVLAMIPAILSNPFQENNNNYVNFDVTSGTHPQNQEHPPFWS